MPKVENYLIGDVCNDIFFNKGRKDLGGEEDDLDVRGGKIFNEGVEILIKGLVVLDSE